MSVAFYIALDDEDPGFDNFVNGKLVAKEIEQLGHISSSLGLPSIESFMYVSADDAESMLNEMLENDDGEPEIPEMQWFDAQTGLDYFEQLAGHIKSNLTTVKNSKGLLSELSEFNAVLEKAKAAGHKWNLQVDF